MSMFVKDVYECVCGRSVFDVIVDGERHALDGVLQVGLRDGGIVEKDGRTRTGLFHGLNEDENGVDRFCVLFSYFFSHAKLQFFSFADAFLDTGTFCYTGRKIS
jgi:hypothetical protein